MQLPKLKMVKMIKLIVRSTKNPTMLVQPIRKAALIKLQKIMKFNRIISLLKMTV